MMRDKKGISLVEFAFSAGLAAMLIVGVTAGVRLLYKDQLGLLSKVDIEKQVFSLASHLLKIGRHAGMVGIQTPCLLNNAPTSPDVSIFTCSVDFNSPPTGVTTKVRFRFSNNQKVYYEQETNPGSGVFSGPLVYDGIAQFLICDETMMENSTCSLTPLKLSEASTTFKSEANRSHRYFRFFIQGVVNASQSKSGDTRPIQMQSAFYIRNPTPSGDIIEWGTQ